MNHLRSLHCAAIELASSVPLKQRLANAFSRHLAILDPTALPASLIPEYTALCSALTAHRPLPGETAVQATVRKLGAAELDALAARVVGLYGDASRLAGIRAVDEPARGKESAPDPLSVAVPVRA